MIGLRTCVPHIFDEIIPSMIRNIIANIYWYITMLLTGRNIATSIGIKAPQVNDTQEAKAAWKGFAPEISVIPSSSRICASRAFFCVYSSHTFWAVSGESQRSRNIFLSSSNSISGISSNSFFLFLCQLFLYPFENLQRRIPLLP